MKPHNFLAAAAEVRLNHGPGGTILVLTKKVPTQAELEKKELHYGLGLIGKITFYKAPDYLHVLVKADDVLRLFGVPLNDEKRTTIAKPDTPPNPKPSRPKSGQNSKTKKRRRR